jgi:hypothetical protein
MKTPDTYHIARARSHTDWREADECAGKLATAEQSRRNRAAAAAKVTVPCEYDIAVHDVGVGERYRDGNGYTPWCSAHDTAGTIVHPGRAAAEAEDWTCPWAGPVRRHALAVIQKAGPP